LPKRSDQISVAATSTKVLDYDPKRTGYRLRNASDAEIYIGPDRGVSITKGYPILNGTFVRFSKKLGDDTTSPVYAISAAGGKILGILEEFGEE